ncbi:hypothetical protein PG999_006006 [Apiospora kogelbergensis]|uniref:tRNA (guanine(9)-N1)-methyltransferase n=1 Tax=Apiospora kogelbergensis TaxID=1337665 RepID=A0AAW0QQZ6_9PEZI
MDASMTDGGLETVAAEKSEIVSREENDKHPEIQAMASDGATTAPSEEAPRGVKRPAEGDPDEDDSGDDAEAAGQGDEAQITTGSMPQPTTKNQLKKLKRLQKWEEGRLDRAEKRREKRRNRQERKKLEREAEIELAKKEGRAPKELRRERDRNPQMQTKVPVSIILDCQYESYMEKNEMVSLANQITRCYSDNRTAEFPVHLAVSSYGGALRQRHETVLHNQQLAWRDIEFVEDDFMGAAHQARETMAGPEGGKVVDQLKVGEGKDSLSWEEPSTASQARKKGAPEPEPEAEDVDKSVVYLTADSPYTLDRIEPNTTYVVGGIIDRNRHKGLCYKVARDRKVRTAKLPIGEFMVLLDRHVLATNHVVEIMLRWLETGDWGEAFTKVIPTRKGAYLKNAEDGATPSEDGAREGEDANHEHPKADDSTVA